MKNKIFKLSVLLLTLIVGIGQVWADRKLYLRPDGGFGGAKYTVWYNEDGGSVTGWTDWMTAVPGTGDAIYETTIPDAVNHVVFCRYDPSTAPESVPQSWSGSGFWNQTYDQTSLGTNHVFFVTTGFTDSKGTGYWTASGNIVAPGTTFYYDNTVTKWGAPWLRIGKTGGSSWTNAYTMSLVKGTANLYKCTITSKWDGYTAFAVTDNCGATNNTSDDPKYDIYNSRGSDKYQINGSTENLTEKVLSPFFTIIATSWKNDGTYGKYYNIEKYGEKKTYTITNTSVDHATVELYYWDELYGGGEGMENVQIVTEGNSAQVLPTTKVWCKVTPDAGYSVPKVMLTDGGAEREWTDASREDAGFEKNCYVVRHDVSFRAVVEPYATKTVLIEDINSWAPNIYFKGWNPFLYAGYDNEQYQITTLKLTDKVHICNKDYYVVTFTNEFPFFYIHTEGGTPRTAFFTYSSLTHMAKYSDDQKGDGNWGLKTDDCGDAIYWVETYKGSGPKYISNVVSNTTDTLSFYVESGATVDFHAGGSPASNQYSTVFAKYFESDAQLDGKAGGVFTATTTGSALTNDTIYDGDYHIHVNAKTRNYLNAGGVGRSGTTGTKFIKFEKSHLFADTYDHYWVDWFLGDNDEGYYEQSVVATVGNEYNSNLAGILGSDNFAPKGMTKSTGGNVRYGYDPETNNFERSIVGSAGGTIKISGLGSDSIMVYNTSTSAYDLNASDEAQSFSDLSNWNYQVQAKVRGQSHATVTTSYVAGTQTLANKKKVLGGAKGTQYEVIVNYDFKTNRLISAWKPTDPITEPFSLESNLMVVRTENGNPTILNISGSGNINSISQIYTVLELTYDNWTKSGGNADRRITSSGYIDEYYWISLPYECHVSDIFGIEGYGSDGSWVIQTYRGDLRAEKGWWAETNAWWYDLDRTDTLKANEGYVIRFTNLNGENGWTTKDRFPGGAGSKIQLYFPSAESDKTIKPLTGTVTTHLDSLKCTKWRKWESDPSGKKGENNPIWDRRAIDSNWRIIGSPSFNSANITDPLFTATDPDKNKDGHVSLEEFQEAVEAYLEANPGATPYSLKYFYNWEVESNTPKFTIVNAATTEFIATHAHLVQYAGKITWNADGSNPLVGIKAPARYQEEETTEQTLRLVLKQGANDADVAYISRMAFGATMGYDLNMDLSKMINANSANIYTMGELYKMAGNCIPDTVETLAVGVQLAADGDYTFAMPDGTYGTGVTLVDNVTGTRTNLALTDYTVTLTAGTYDERFELELSPIAQTPTDIETISDKAKENGVRKVMVDGVLYIVRDGKVFDARGNRVK